ncbi:ADAMTS-like protein 1 isoform X3 [Mya arenaria]|uniref:ADAMTS-like protein 1 isoform X3 n=1 Tax=Mya arenaria TaxID=6604 RepID=UPI0022E470E6|nr:ADAMTS-like protein 1 isoform X3 [Mya arenaria]
MIFLKTTLPILVWLCYGPKVLAVNTSAEWSGWGSYGDCSRPCGGGLSNRTRTCLGASHTCNGTNIRYKVCNSQPCDVNGTKIRAVQCRSYNNVSLKDNLYHWEPHYDPRAPCSLLCRTVETGFVLKMQTHVLNGTSCGEHLAGVCIAGKCKRVGCDNIVGSTRKLDSCGVCGGDGSSCKLPRDDIQRHDHRKQGDKGSHWVIRWDTCSKTCGQGVQTATLACVDGSTDAVVPEALCSQQQRPETPPIRTCADNRSCTFRWHTFKWGSCSRTCGDGFMYRRVSCLKQLDTGERKDVPDRKCTEVKPNVKAPCNMADCPEWLTEHWSPCSVTCGYGEQKRKVVCRAKSADSCVSVHKPEMIQKCYSGVSCEEDDLASFQQDESSVTRHDFFDDERLQELFLFPQYQVSGWGSCSVTCGVGYRHRNVTCIKGGHMVPLTDCEGIEPHSKRECHNQQCPISVATATTFAWKHGNFKPCSQSCGRGTQTSIVECVDTRSDSTVIDFLCDGQQKPEPTTRHCNRVQCPPAWKVSEYGECSVPCGGGRQSREVDCVQTTAYGGIQALPRYRCPDPVPLAERSCNLQFCQAEWNTGKWGECSVTCGLGVEGRSVFCVKLVKADLQVNVSDAECFGPRPPSTRQCFYGECYELQQLPRIQEQKGTFIQIKRSKRIRLFVGEDATLLPNQAVKIKCPVKNFQKKLIFWTKNHRLIPLVGRVRVSSNGALRITRASPTTDSGTYTCSAGTLHANIHVAFQSKKEAKQKAAEILDSIFVENFNESFINRPQSDSNFKMKNTKFFHVNSVEGSSEYDYSSFTFTKWSECSAKCGLGTQTRIVTCNHVTDKYIRLPSDEECLKKGLSKPLSVQKCVIEAECPKWLLSDWTECSVDNCRREGYSARRRSVWCRYGNGSMAPDIRCVNGGAGSRPSTKEHCKNSNCTAVWKTSDWSECSGRCGSAGQKYRTLRCEWATTGSPANFACQHKPRPTVSKDCKLSPCPKGPCTDNTNHCQRIVRLNMCRYTVFRRMCCHSCKNAIYTLP